jgi:hypothetical protein
LCAARRRLASASKARERAAVTSSEDDKLIRFVELLAQAASLRAPSKIKLQ